MCRWSGAGLPRLPDGRWTLSGGRQHVDAATIAETSTISSGSLARFAPSRSRMCLARRLVGGRPRRGGQLETLLLPRSCPYRSLAW